MGILKMKKFKKLEMDQIFHQVVRYESQLLGVDEHWNKWLYKADRELNLNYPSSTTIGCKNYNNTRCWFKYFANFWIEDNGTCKVGYHEGIKEGYTFFDAYQAYVEKNDNIASREYLKLFGINPDKKYKNIFGIDSDKLPRVECTDYLEQVPESFFIKEVQFNKTGVFELRNDRDLIIGAYIRYASSDEYFYMYGKIEKAPYIGEYYLKIGRPNGDIPVFNTNELVKYDAPVIFIMSLEAALSLDRINEKLSRVQYTVCSCIDNAEVSNVDFSYFYGKDIYFVPEPSDKSILKCIEYLDKFEIDSSSAKFTEKILVNSIMVSKRFIPFLDRSQKERLEESPNPFDRYLATCCGEKEEDICLDEQSLPPAKFRDWLCKMGVLPASEGEAETSRSVSVVFDNQESTYSKDSLEHYLRRFMLTGIIGESNAGKTMLGYTMAACLAAGKDFLDFEVEKSHSVLYFDAETGMQDVQDRVKRIFDGYDISEKIFGKNLHIVPLLDNRQRDMPEVELMTDDFQRWIHNCIKEYNAEYVFFDNLASLGNNIDSHHNWPKVKEIFREIETTGCSVIFFHHLKKDGDISGSEKIENLSQNVIALRGRKAISDKYSKLKLDGLPPADCVFELEYMKSKGDNRRNSTKQIWQLKADPSDSRKEGRWIRLDAPQTNTKESLLPETEAQAKTIFRERMGREPIPEDGKKGPQWKRDVLLLYAIKRYLTFSDSGESWFVLADVENLFKSKDQDKRNHLAKLVGAELLEEKKKENSKQRATRWQYRTEN